MKAVNLQVNLCCVMLCLCWACKDKSVLVNDNPILGDEQVTFNIAALPEHHDFSTDIYISGDFEGWSGGREQFKLVKQDQKYTISIPKYKHTINFKFTKGQWATVECESDGHPIKNRGYTFTGKNDTIPISIVNWKDLTNEESPSTAQHNVTVFDEAFDIPQLERQRRISIYLPPNYEDSTERYPVVYMLDGQNIFDAKTSYTGEWEVDETLNTLFKKGRFGLIVVAIDHGGESRLKEYAPWDHETYGKGEGRAFTDFLVNTLKPVIDSTYRTKPDKKHTAIMGSSMGGLLTHYAAFAYPEVFGKAGVFSPSYWRAPECYEFTERKAHQGDLKVYLAVGDKEGAVTIENVKRMSNILKSSSFPREHLLTSLVEDGRHNETFWKSEFKNAISWLFNVN